MIDSVFPRLSTWSTMYDTSATDGCLGSLGKSITSTMVAYAFTDVRLNSNGWVPFNYADIISKCSTNRHSCNSSCFLLNAQ